MLKIQSLHITNNRRNIKKILKKSIKDFCNIYLSPDDILYDIDFYKTFIIHNKNITRYDYIRYNTYTTGLCECITVYSNNRHRFSIDSSYDSKQFDKLNIIYVN